jgi:flagellar assembly protein FliH
MGKIVKSARMIDRAYTVAIPPVGNGTVVLAAAGAERDNVYAASQARAPFADESLEAESTTATEPVECIDFETLRKEAEAIVDRAAADAEALIRQAESVALETLERSRANAGAIEDQARVQGRDRGYAEGKAAAGDELAPVIATMREMIESIRSQRANVISSAEPELVRLAMAIAERIVHAELMANPNIVVENVRQALTRLVTREVITLRVNPADHDAVRAHRDAIVAASDVEHLRIVEDQRVDRGGVIVETDAGTIDAKILTQLREARRAILGDDDAIALGDEQTLAHPAQAS